ncbi:integrator complex subunit 10 [Contarinia nasturtii]|uniref:integrator complex subunit 10 n=1 Tax=Contarinia nasturtii TaxID=265458 RepID=UPI0012D44FA6|nr:integrator complex subunit 10 [Contarinia nasturtii]
MSLKTKIENDENYFIKKAKLAEETDPFTAKAWILTAKSLSPNNFDVQFEVYKQEKAAKNYAEAAKCFSYIMLTFQNQPPELLRREIIQLTTALRAPETEKNPKKEEDFYVEMFQHISLEVQNRILLSLKRDSDNSLDYCQFVLLLMKKFPQMLNVNLPHLLEALVQNTSSGNQKNCIKMLLFEVVPIIIQKPPSDLSASLVHRILTLGLEFYTSQIFLLLPAEFSDTVNLTPPICWSRIFEIVDVCGRILKWEPFLPYNSSWSKDVYWQKLYHIVSLSSTRPSENKQILFYGTCLFIVSLHDYINSMKQKVDDNEIRYILIETMREENEPPIKPPYREPNIITNPRCDKEVAILFRTAVQCWQLLQSNEILQIDFKQLLLSLPCSPYVNQFLVDLAFYLGQPEESQTLMNDSTLGTSNLEKNLRYLSLTLHQPTFQVPAFELMMKVLADLPSQTDKYVKNITSNVAGRNMVFLPLTKRPILQYCIKILVKTLKAKLENETQHYRDSNSILGSMLVLIQLNYPSEIKTAEFIFERIRSKQSFSFPDFSTYIICPDFLEEFMYLYTNESSKIQLELSPQTATALTRRIGTRGSDRGIKDEFKQLIRKQMARSNEEIEPLILHFITQERNTLMQLIFDK